MDVLLIKIYSKNNRILKWLIYITHKMTLKLLTALQNVFNLLTSNHRYHINKTGYLYSYLEIQC